MSTDRAASLAWKRDGSGWRLSAGHRRFGVVSPAKQPGMWQSKKPDGSQSDIANISWSKNAVLTAAERELEFEDRQRRAIDPANCPENGGVSDGSRSPVRGNRRAGIRRPKPGEAAS
jgi:hypothetical protein